MRDRSLTYAIGISIAVHLGVIALVGHTYASRLSVRPVLAHPKFINVDLIDTSKSQKSQPLAAPKVSTPKPAPVLKPSREVVQALKNNPNAYAPRPVTAAAPTTSPRSVPGNPGGRLNTGTPSAHGDLNMGSNGNTRVGGVPNENTESPGEGSGTGPGVGQPDPPRNADPGPSEKPAPAPPPPPEPRKISVDVCSASGMLPGKYCDKKVSRSYVEGNEPSRTCTECKEQVHISRLADRADPVLIRDAKVDVPSSVEEGLSFSITISYTVTADGDVAGIEVTKSSGNRAVDRAVTSKAPQMKYKPAVQDGIPRSVRKTRTYVINT